ncbi:MAG: SRPBCC domain-containing protein [Pirellulales bacterium]
MPNVVTAVTLPATPDRLFDMYLDADDHSSFTGAPAIIEPQPGGRFSAFGEALTGIILRVQPKRLIVQSWRSANWPEDAIDSTLVLSFWPQGEGARIELVHVNVPEIDFAGVSQGWHQYYWAPWRAYLDSNPAG